MLVYLFIIILRIILGELLSDHGLGGVLRVLVVEALHTELPGLDVKLVDFLYRCIWCHHDVK